MRKYTEERERAGALADSFQGLPPNFSHWRLCDELSHAREPLGLDSDALWLLVFYIKRSQAQDWERGAEPIVAWPTFEISALTGWSEDKVGRVNDRLCDLGLTAYRDAPNCKRRAFRGQDGAIAGNASGISLAPAGARALEIAALAHEKFAQVRALHRAFGEIFEIRADLMRFRGARELPREMIAAIVKMIDALPKRRDPHAINTVVNALRERASALLNAVRAFLGLDEPECPESAGEAVGGAEKRSEPHIQIEPTMEEPRVIRSATVRNLHRRDAEHKQPDSNNLEKEQDLVGILAASPEIFKTYLETAQGRCRRNAWEEILNDAMEHFGSDLALQPSFIGRLNRSFGLIRTLKALFALAEVTENGREIRNPAGYAMALASKGGMRLIGQPMQRARAYNS